MAPESRASLPWPALAGMMLAAALAPLGSTMIAVALPDIGRELDVGGADLTQWLVASYLVASIALQSPGGKLGDLVTHRRALLLGLVLAAVGSVLGFAFALLPTLVAARVLMAAGGAIVVPATMAILRNRVAADRRARAFGWFGACMGIAAAIGPLVGGELTELFGWRAIFAASLAAVAISLALLMAPSGERAAAPRAERPGFDVLGSALLAAGLSLVILALQVGGTHALWLGSGGAVLLALFPLQELRARSPVVKFSLFRTRAFTAGGLIIGLQNLAMYALLFQMPIFLTQVRLEGPHEIGRALLGLTLAMVAASLVGGRTSERIGARAQACIGSLLALGGLYWFRDFEALTTATDALPGLVCMGAGIGLTSAPSQAAAMSGAGRETAGMAAGVLSTMRYVGGVAGIATMGALLANSAEAASHNAPIPAYAAALGVSALLALLLPGRIAGAAVQPRPAGQ